MNLNRATTWNTARQVFGIVVATSLVVNFACARDENASNSKEYQETAQVHASRNAPAGSPKWEDVEAKHAVLSRNCEQEYRACRDKCEQAECFTACQRSGNACRASAVEQLKVVRKEYARNRAKTCKAENNPDMKRYIVLVTRLKNFDDVVIRLSPMHAYGPLEKELSNLTEAHTKWQAETGASEPGWVVLEQGTDVIAAQMGNGRVRVAAGPSSGYEGRLVFGELTQCRELDAGKEGIDISSLQAE